MKFDIIEKIGNISQKVDSTKSLPGSNRRLEEKI
jgi:hypothetical protein